MKAMVCRKYGTPDILNHDPQLDQSKPIVMVFAFGIRILNT